MKRLLKYEIVAKLHDGKNSVVYRAARISDNCPVILKTQREDCPPPESLARLQREYKMLLQLAFPGIVQAVVLEDFQDKLVLVLEDIGGRALDQHLQERTLPLRKLLELGIQAAGILDQVHAAGIIHRDINPSNFIWNADTNQLKLSDFGLAVPLPTDSVFQSPGRIEGTLPYLAPEQTGRINQSVDSRADLYALGAMLYEMFTGHPPFEMKTGLEMIHAHMARAPIPPHEIRPSVPPALSAVVLKLLAKDKEDRYQTAFGVQSDLKFCQRWLEVQGAIPPFPLAEHDLPERLQIPQKLYGRQPEIAALLETFERASRGRSEIMVVAGFSGVGKSSLIHEVHKPITEKHGYFATGKFNQFQQSIPFSAFRQAFDSFCHYLLTEAEAALEQKRRDIREAVGDHGQVLIETIPALELVIGKQPPVDSISPQEAQNRFTSVFQNFLRVVCRPEHPLALFIDDWQWADAGSVLLLKQIATAPSLKYLLIFCACRDNEVTPAHPFLMALEELRRQGVPITSVAVRNLQPPDLGALVSGALHQPLEQVQELVQLIHEKTLGNPFFAKTFLKTLHQEGLVTFDRSARAWRWDLLRIRQKGLTDNVVELLAGNISRLPPATQHILTLAASLGNRFDLHTLAVIARQTPSECVHGLWQALGEGLIQPLDENYQLPDRPAFAHQSRFRFQHDRVQQAAYGFIAPEERAALHLNIGQLMLAGLDPAEREDRLFEVVDHLNLGAALIQGQDRQVNLVALNLDAARKAKAAIAYPAALQYCRAADAQVRAASLAGELWRSHYNLALNLHKDRSELEYINGDFAVAEQLLREAVAQARTPLDKAEVYHGLIVQFTLQARYREAIATGRQALATLGIELPETEYEAARDAEMRQARETIGGRPVASLFDLPVMTDPEKRLAVKLLIAMGPPCYRSHQRLWAVIVPKVVNLCLRFGNVPQIGYSHTAFGGLLGWAWNDYTTANQFGELATRLMTETFRFPSEQSVFYLMIGSSLRHWSKHLKHSTLDYLEAYHIGLRSSNLQYAAYAFGHNMYCRFFQGTPLPDLLQETQNYLDFSLNRHNQWAIDLLEGGQILFGALCSKPLAPLAKGQLTETAFLERCEAHQNIQVICIYHVLKTFLHYLLGDYEWAWASFEKADRLIYTVGTQGLLPWPQHVFTHSLLLAATGQSTGPEAPGAGLARLRKNLEQLQLWARHCPENFEHQQLLVAAELARLEERPLEALELYDQAIAAAREQGFVQHQAVASESAARFWLGRRKKHLALPYLRQARSAYERWGATAKLAPFDALYGDWLEHQAVPARPSTSTDSSRITVELDVTTIVTAARSLSETVQLEPLLNNLMSILMANAGAESGTLLLPQGDAWLIQAEGGPGGAAVLQSQPLDPARKPMSVILYTARTHQPLMLHNPHELPEHGHDEYLRRRQPKSLCCVPLLHRGRVVGIIYLENSLTGGVFTTPQVELLKLLSTQMASAIVNAQVYDDLEKAVEQRTAQLAEANQALQASLDEKVVLLKEVHHRVKNNLQLVVSLLNLQARKQPNPQLVESFRELQNRVNSMSMLHEILYRSENLARVNFAGYISQLCAQLAKSFGTAARRIELKYRIENASLAMDQAVPCGLIINELVTNAMKYAFPASQGGQISIEMTASGSHVILQVSDNGVGLPENVDAHRAGSLGLKLVHILAEQLRGTIAATSQGGASFTIRFPITPA